jgi:hypothetical protein
MRRTAEVGALVLVALASACGGGDTTRSNNDDTVQATAPLALQDPGPVHVHGLGLAKERGTLFIATHTGLFELHAGDARATRVGDSHQDTMGFFVLPDGRFLGSGHPDARENRPPHLGLIESRDKGRSWRTISLDGEADFHVLRAHGRTVYGFDSSNDRFLVSRDGGRTWTERGIPETFIDLAIDPSNPQHVIASGGSALYRSTDGGVRWTPVASGLSGYLAWPAAKRLFVATLDGALLTAADATGAWRAQGQLGGPVAALHASSAEELFVALHDGTILRSTDSGRSWMTRSIP